MNAPLAPVPVYELYVENAEMRRHIADFLAVVDEGRFIDPFLPRSAYVEKLREIVAKPPRMLDRMCPSDVHMLDHYTKLYGKEGAIVEMEAYFDRRDGIGQEPEPADDDEPRVDPNDEHRLSAVQLDIGRAA